MGTSVRMIELHYGTLVEGAHDSLLARLDHAPALAEQAEAERFVSRLSHRPPAGQGA